MDGTVAHSIFVKVREFSRIFAYRLFLAKIILFAWQVIIKSIVHRFYYENKVCIRSWDILALNLLCIHVSAFYLQKQNFGSMINIHMPPTGSCLKNNCFLKNDNFLLKNDNFLLSKKSEMHVHLKFSQNNDLLLNHSWVTRGG